METFIVYIDDQSYARQQLIPMLAAQSAHRVPARWVVVGCAPRLNRHTGRWLTQGAHKKWRQTWTQTHTAEVVQLLEASGNSVSVRTAHGPLAELTKQLMGEMGSARVMDARRPKPSVHHEPVTPQQPRDDARWVLPSGVLVMGAALVMASD